MDRNTQTSSLRLLFCIFRIVRLRKCDTPDAETWDSLCLKTTQKLIPPPNIDLEHSLASFMHVIVPLIRFLSPAVQLDWTKPKKCAPKQQENLWNAGQELCHFGCNLSLSVSCLLPGEWMCYVSSVTPKLSVLWEQHDLWNGHCVQLDFFSWIESSFIQYYYF